MNIEKYLKPSASNIAPARKPSQKLSVAIVSFVDVWWFLLKRFLHSKRPKIFFLTFRSVCPGKRHSNPLSRAFHVHTSGNDILSGPCSWGNHSRSTRRPDLVATGAKQSSRSQVLRGRCLTGRGSHG